MGRPMGTKRPLPAAGGLPGHTPSRLLSQAGSVEENKRVTPTIQYPLWGTAFRQHLRMLLLAGILALAVAAPASAATPSSAYTKISRCMVSHGAVSVKPHGHGEGIAWWPGTYKWLSWSFATVGGRVVDVGYALSLPEGKLKRQALACLAPWRTS